MKLRDILQKVDWLERLDEVNDTIRELADKLTSISRRVNGFTGRINKVVADLDDLSVRVDEIEIQVTTTQEALIEAAHAEGAFDEVAAVPDDGKAEE